MSDPETVSPNIQVGIEAMHVLLSGQNTDAESFRVAAEKLQSSLSARPQIWAEWLADPSHANAARSMSIAVEGPIYRALSVDPENKPVVDALNRIALEAATTMAIANEFAAHYNDAVIDLTDSSKEQLKAGAN